MRAAVLVEPSKIVLERRPCPQPVPGDVLVAVRRAGLCGSDLHYFDGSSPVDMPLILGHELAGEIVALGPGVTNRRIGDRVIIEPTIPCGHCFPCRRGKYNCCDHIDMIGIGRPGGFADYVTVPANYAHLMPAAMSFEHGAVVEPFTIGAQILHRAEPRPCDTIVLTGLGPIGLTVITLLKAWHKEVRVIGIDLVTERIANARGYGCDIVLNAREVDVVKKVMELTKDEGAAIVIECAGTPATIQQTVQLVATGGRIVIAGVTFRDICFPGRSFTKKEVEIYGSRNNAGHFPKVIEFISQNPEIAQRYISAVLPFEEITAAFQWAKGKPNEVTKILLKL
ncbi:MAG: alcohol dehydrogenase catalytic domain-containing protein [Opitutaceae bacterium]|nr:alcohol dehydrogenase catalytic domain-containing protein [Opitutaceae bacterium]